MCCCFGNLLRLKQSGMLERAADQYARALKCHPFPGTAAERSQIESFIASNAKHSRDEEDSKRNSKRSKYDLVF